MLTLDIQRDTDDPSPADEALQAAVGVALEVAELALQENTELSLRIVNKAEIRELNHRYRQQDKATNVLSFPSDLPRDLPLQHLGDIVICAAIVREEAAAQHKKADAHWAHMLVHGTLHLLGYDHENDDDALLMETLEARAMDRMGWPHPYEPAANSHNTPATGTRETCQ